MMDHSFQPGFWAKNPHLQTFFASSRIRNIGGNPMLEAAREMIVDAGAGVRLLGYYSGHSPEYRKGLVTLLHGWEGSANSAYILSAGKYLFAQGYDVFRLNLRDHGDSHYLNEGLFHGALIDETSCAVMNIARLQPPMPYYLAGFSLGGNFALRIALRQSKTRFIPTLRHIISISPALDPCKSTVAIDQGPGFYRRYFLKKWKRSLEKKQALFPSRYDFTDLLKMDTCMAITEAIMRYYPEFKDYRSYFSRYTLLGNVFRDLSFPVTIIGSEDDPVIPVEDFRGLKHGTCLKMILQKHGGHCGFFTSFPFDCWCEKMIGRIISDDALSA